ncbi:galactose-1-epimerase [Shimwellia pseudoproteus]|uniref:galactose-1-epimerase n=1 Tax=Shimwellia pseudoproteus TaxID=570012 RepID=UPI0018ED990C|nr:galactose-1-epimerase [Shimwellia pseudoproteus]
MLKETPQLAPDGQPFRLSTLRNQAGAVVTMMDWGATLLSCRIPLRDGSVRETLLGCPSPEHYLAQSAFLGASVGRYANRIANSQYTHQGETVHLAPSQGDNQLHGGPEGFDKRRWRILRLNTSEVLYTLDSPDGDQGFPGNFRVTALYQLTEDNRIRIQFTAWCDKTCPVNLTNHAYFNLDAEPGDAREHQLQLLADQYLPVDAGGIPRRGLADVANTSFDFRTPKTISSAFLSDADQQAVNGYDHAWLLNARGDATQPAAHLWSRDRRLKLSVYTSAPALQFYAGNFLAGTPAREQGQYQNWQGLALESEFLPDSPNHPEWPQPDCFLAPQQEYVSITEYQFTEQ